MKNVKKLNIALCLAATILAAPGFAQVESKSFYSNGYKSTAETIRTDTENFIDVRYFDQVKFDKLFLMTNFSRTDFTLGAATVFNNFYFSGLYSGEFWKGLSGHNNKASENTKHTYIDSLETNEKTLTKDIGSGATTTQRAIFMMGLPNKMGIKLDSYLSFKFSDKKINDKTNSIGESLSTETLNNPKTGTEKTIDNRYRFDLLWSCFDLPVGNFNIKPWARVGVDMYDRRNVTYNKEINKRNDKNDPHTNIDSVKIYNETVYNDETPYNYGFCPLLNVDLGSDFAIKHNDIFSSLIVADYKLACKIYANMDTSVENEKFVDNLNNKNNWSRDVVTSRTGKVDLTNSLKGTYKFEVKPIEKLTLAGRVGLNTSVKYSNPGQSVTTTTENKYNNSGKKTITVSKNGEIESITVDGVISDAQGTYISKDVSDKTVTTKFVPTFGLGVAYAVKPNFVLNFGYSGYIPTISIVANTVDTKTTTTTYNFADPTAPTVASVKTENNKTSNVDTTTGSYGSSLSTGFTWTMGQCCALDVAVSISRTPSFDKVWNAGWNLGFSFKN